MIFFFKERRIRYNKDKCLQYDIKFDYSKTIHLLSQDLKRVITEALIESLEKIKNHKKIKYFDFETFKTDFKNVLESKTVTNN
ncbi:hypothetical protein GCM10009119_35840 [Algoriphagus jejuensis]|uniref:Uncharacterized protein n=1 Tax=Algoriphagus jejuensis TaxID=419934 RepID=A0ABP3YJA9_9BACT